MSAMSEPRRRREIARGERVLPGVWRLRLPLPWPGVPHCNAWAIASGDGIVLFDTGMATDDGLRQLELASPRSGFGLADVRLVVCTHSHTDHYGLAGPIVDAAGCELWMHPAWGHVRRMAEDPDGALDRRIEVARQSGVPAAALELYEQRRGTGTGIARLVEPRPRAGPRRRGRDRPRRLGGPRDARPRALARRPARARERPADLRRPPARPDLALLRLRPHPRSGGRVHRRPRRGRPARAHGALPRRPRAAVSRRAGEGRRQPGGARRPTSSGCAAASRMGRGRRSSCIGEIVGPENVTPATGAWGLQLALAYIDHLVAAGELVEVEGSDPRLAGRYSSAMSSTADKPEIGQHERQRPSSAGPTSSASRARTSRRRRSSTPTSSGWSSRSAGATCPRASSRPAT